MTGWQLQIFKKKKKPYANISFLSSKDANDIMW